MALLVLDQCRQRRRFLQIIIDTGNETVLKGQPSSRLLKICMTGFQHIVQLIAVRHRHQSLSHLIIRRVEREGQGDGEPLISQLKDSRNNAAGGQCNVSLADVQPMLIRQQADKLHHIVIVIHRLSRTHDHHVGYPFPCKILNPVDLVQHLRRP